jgi:trimeric autotransporter adhesin
MGTGYTRNDTVNNIADGNIINASDLDGEFDAVQAAFDAATGHTHDGTTGEGAPIEVTGPAQEYVSTGTEFRPKANNTYDLGSSGNQWKDLYIDGTANLDAVDIDGGNIDGTVIGASTAAAGTFTTATATTGNITTVNATTVDTTNIEVTNIKAKDGTAAGSIADATGVVTLASSVLTTTDINGGTIDGTTIGGASAAAGTFTTATATTGNITTVNATTVDSTNVEVTNIKAKDGTASATIADSTGVMTVASSVLTTTDINGGTIDGTVIGGSTPAAISGTTGQFGTSLNVDGTVTANGVAIDGDSITANAQNALTFEFATATGIISADRTGGNFGELSLRTTAGSTPLQRLNISYDGDISFYEDTGTTPKFFWDASAEALGIGNAAPTAALDVTGAAAISGNLTVDTNTLFVDAANNRVGVGTATPATNLHIDGGTGQVVQVGPLSLTNFADEGSGVIFGRTTDGALTQAIGTVLVDSLGVFGRENIVLATGGSGLYGATTERMRITSTGSVGIGTATPDFYSGKLTVAGGNIALEGGNRALFWNTGGTGVASIQGVGTNELSFSTSNSFTERMRITSAGDLLVGKTTAAVSTNGSLFSGTSMTISASASNTYHVYNTAASSYPFYVSFDGTVNYTALNALSDAREKENVVDIDRGLAEVMALRPVKFDWRNSEKANNAGFIAQEMQAVLPEFVAEAMHDEKGNTRLRVSTAELIPVLVKAIQDQQAIIEALEARITALEA